MKHDKIVLSINHEGRLSLWDSTDIALKGKEDGEVVVSLPLADYQQGILAKAVHIAQDNQKKVNG